MVAFVIRRRASVEYPQHMFFCCCFFFFFFLFVCLFFVFFLVFFFFCFFFFLEKSEKYSKHLKNFLLIWTPTHPIPVFSTVCIMGQHRREVKVHRPVNIMIEGRQITKARFKFSRLNVMIDVTLVIYLFIYLMVLFLSSEKDTLIKQ